MRSAKIVPFLRDNPPGYLSDKTPGEIGLLDAITAGSNHEDVVNVLDGDPTTYWEPDPPGERSDLASSWWFRIDLGRIVVANRIVVTFVDEELGDPFYLFEVLTSDGQTPVSARGGRSIDFLPVLQMVEPNTTRRRFEVDFTDAPKLSREMVVRFIQVVARGSRLDRGLEIDAGEYERLQQESRETPGRSSTSSSGPEAGRSPSARRTGTASPTRPGVRSATSAGSGRGWPKSEVWEEGEDVARDLLDRGGSISSLPKIKIGPKGMFDGDVYTSFPAVWYVLDDAIRQPGIVADLGSFFWVKSVRIVQSLTGALITFSLGNHQLDLSDGSKRVDGSLRWVTTKVVAQAVMAKQPREDDPSISVSPTKSHVERHTLDTPVKARFVRLAYERTPRIMHAAVYPITEWQVFATGFQPQVTIASPLIDPRGTRTLTSIEWDAETPPGTPPVPADPHQPDQVGGHPVLQGIRRRSDEGAVRQAPETERQGENPGQPPERGHRHRGGHGQRLERLERSVPGLGGPHHLPLAAQVRPGPGDPPVRHSRGGSQSESDPPQLHRSAGRPVSRGTEPHPGGISGGREALLPVRPPQFQLGKSRFRRHPADRSGRHAPRFLQPVRRRRDCPALRRRSRRARRTGHAFPDRGGQPAGDLSPHRSR